MCDPLTVAAAVATIGGTAASAIGQQQAQSAITNTANANIAQQRAYMDQANNLFQDSLKQANPDTIKADAAADTAQRQTALLTNNPGLPSLVPGGQDYASRSTTAQGKSIMDKSNADLTQEASGRAALGGTNDAFRTLAINTQPNADKINELGSDIVAQNNLLPLEEAAASRAGGGLRTFGSLLTGAGRVAAMGAGPGLSDTANNANNWLKLQFTPNSPSIGLSPNDI